MTEAITQEDPSYATSILLERLEAWKHVCAYLEDYIGATEKVQKAHSKEYEKVLKTISHPIREEHHFDKGLGGIAGMLDNMRSNTQAIADAHAETEKNLKGSVLPTLEKLHSDIKHKIKELSSGAAKGSKSVDKARTGTQQLIGLLKQHTAAFDSVGHVGDASADPYVIQRQLWYRLDKQINEENANRDELLAEQESFERFEGQVVHAIQRTVSSFVQVLNNQADRTKALYGDMATTTSKIPPNFEWMGFVRRNDSVLLDPEAPPRTIKTVQFPNKDHPSTRLLIDGKLQRKSRLAVKGYSSAYYVVTPSKYLHEYKDDDNFTEDPTPELSLYLPDCTVGGVNGPKFTVKGKNVAKGKIAVALSTKHELEFKASSPEEAKRWWDVIRPMATDDQSMPDLSPTTTEPDTPIKREHGVADKDHHHHHQHQEHREQHPPPAYAEQHAHPQQHPQQEYQQQQAVPPMQTQGLERQQGQGAPGSAGTVPPSALGAMAGLGGGVPPPTGAAPVGQGIGAGAPATGGAGGTGTMPPGQGYAGGAPPQTSQMPTQTQPQGQAMSGAQTTNVPQGYTATYPDRGR